MTDERLTDRQLLPPTDVMVLEPPEPATFDRADIEMLFRCLMQFARHLAKKYGFTIKQWPEN